MKINDCLVKIAAFGFLASSTEMGGVEFRYQVVSLNLMAEIHSKVRFCYIIITMKITICLVKTTKFRNLATSKGDWITSIW